MRGPSIGRGTGPAAADRSMAAARPGRTVRSWPLLVLAAPAAAEVWSGWVGIAQKTGFGLVSPLPGIWPSLHLDTTITLPVGVEAYAAYALRAWLGSGHYVSPRTRRFAKWSAICSFALGMGGAGRLPPARPGRGHTGAVADHHPGLLPAGAGPGHGDRAGPHAPRRHSPRGHAAQPGRRTSHPPVPRVVRGPDRTAPGPGRTPPGADRVRSPGQDQTVPAPGPQRDSQDHPVSPTGSAAADEPRPPHRPQARRRRETSITTCAAQRRSQGLQPSPQHPGPQGQRGTSSEPPPGLMTPPTQDRADSWKGEPTGLQTVPLHPSEWPLIWQFLLNDHVNSRSCPLFVRNAGGAGSSRYGRARTASVQAA